MDQDLSNCSASEPFALRVIGDEMAPEFTDGPASTEMINNTRAWASIWKRQIYRWCSAAVSSLKLRRT